MRYQYIFILLLLLTACGSENNDWKQYNLKGKVQSVEELYYLVTLVDEVYQKQEAIESESDFLDSDFSDAMQSSKTFVEFDENGYKTMLTLNDSIKMVYERNKQHKVVKKLTSSTLVQSIETFEYEDDKPVRQVLTDAQLNVFEEIQFSYQESTKVRAVTQYFETETANFQETIRLNQNQQAEMSTTTDQGMFVEKWKAIYNKDNRLVRKEYYNDQDVIDQVDESVYDEKGNEINFKVHANNASTPLVHYRYLYQYDDKGNWITKISISDEGYTSLCERTINYY